MYCDPVAGIRLSAQDTNVVVASCFRSSLEYQISWLCICFADNTGLLPLVRRSISNCCLHSLILISIVSLPTVTKTACSPDHYARSVPELLLPSADTFSTEPHAWVVLPITVDLPSPRNTQPYQPREYAAVITSTRSSETSSPTLSRTKPLDAVTTAQRSLQSVSTYFLKDASVFLRNIVLLDVVVDLVISVGYLGNILFVPDDRVHLRKDPCQIILTGCIQCK